MPYVTKEQIEAAKQMDLLSYLQTYEPDELVRLSGNVYTTRTHDSLKISNGKWCWWSHDIGGRSALDYLIKVQGMSLPEAVLRINGQAVTMPPACSRLVVQDELKTLLLPDRNENNDRVISYLVGRGIHCSIIEFCIHTGRLYESRGYHNAVFVGFDPQGAPRYGMLRGATGSRFMGDAPGSDKRYSFSIPASGESQKLHLFESAIDLLSFGTLLLLEGKDWRQEHCLSLAGVYKPRRTIGECALPMALAQFLMDVPKINNISLHLDNDEPGRLAAGAIMTKLMDMFIVDNCPPHSGKDYNEMLQKQLGIETYIKHFSQLER